MNGLFQNIFSKQDFSLFIFSNQENKNQEIKNELNNDLHIEKKATNNSIEKNANSNNATTKNNDKKDVTTNTNVTDKSKNNTTNNSINVKKTKTPDISNVNKMVEVKFEDWRIIIPSIGVNAPIAEGTSTDVMNRFVGHFENTDVWNGNVALAAHNRGYPVNFFSNIKYLNAGEIIEYYYQGNLRKYTIQTVTVIKDTDWSYLAKTSDNKITLITCVEDQPEYRRCIQAVEI